MKRIQSILGRAPSSRLQALSVQRNARFTVLALAVLVCSLFLAAPTAFLGGGAQKGGGGSQDGNVKEEIKGTERHPKFVPFSTPAAAFAISEPVRNLPAAEPGSGKTFRTPADDESINRTNRVGGRKVDPEVKSSPDAALVSPARPSEPNTAPPAPTVNFDGLNNADNSAAFGFRVSPPDTNMDVGPNHVVASVNLLLRIYNKSGTPLTAPFKMSSLFASLGGVCATLDDGDPVVLYDPLADRWLISQFALPSFPAPPYSMCIAISQTPDPTGAYFLYNFITGGAAGTQLPDYPKLAVWPDGYYMTTRQFTNGVAFANPGAVVFDRLKMLTGDPTALQIYFDLSTLPPIQNIDGMLPSDIDGLVTPPVGTPNVFSYYTATEFGDPGDALRLFNFHADFVNPLNSTFTERAESPLAVAAFDPISPAGRDDIDQPPPSTAASRLDSISDFLMHRLQYRNRGGFESFVVNHTVDVSGNATAAVFRAGVRYYELRRTTGSANPLSVFEQATFAPADTENRWMGSAGVDNNGNLAFGYSVSSATVFPSIRYAGKLAGEAVGVLTETNMITGSGVQTSTGSRWGDYSMMAVDPADDCTFWYTQEYYTAASQATSTVGWLTRIASFKYTQCADAPKGTINGTITNCNTGQPIQGASITTPEGYFGSSNASGSYSIMATPGTFNLTVSFPGFGTGIGTAVVTNGGATTVNICLTPTPIIVSAGATLVSESCTPANGALDPNETVTVSFCVQNTGALNTTNLVGTLQNTGGVTGASGPQNYGVVVAGGPSVCRNFTFLVSGTCGGTITASIQFQDGATNLGTVTYTFTLGVLNVVFSENFDGVTPPALPAGWSATQGVNLTGAPLWVTSTATPDTAPNHAFSTCPNNILDNRLDTPGIAIVSASSQLSFRNNFDLQDVGAGFDGSALEISSPNINAGAFTDIITAGGSFVSGGYTNTISAGFGNPLGGRMGWSGTSAGYITTLINLPAVVNGQTIVLRFRLGADNSFSSVGWRVDTVSVTSGFVCSTSCPPPGCTGITCPANITVSNDNNQCGAVVNYPAPTPVGSGCGTITCSPSSGSFFPVGTTTVTCTATAGPSCMFTVTVNDTQPPTITCPLNVTAVTPTPADPCVVVNFTATASDNCPGVVVACNPPSGSCFPVGVTTVTCTATDASGNTATCSFTVSVFNGRLQDDSAGCNNTVLFNTINGAYRWCCNGTIFTGTAKVKKLGNTFTLEHNAPDRRVLIKLSAGSSPPSGNASLQFPPGTIRCVIHDRDTRNDTCVCGGAPI